MSKRTQVQAEVGPEVREALKRAVLAAGGYGHNARIIREALEQHPEVRAQLGTLLPITEIDAR